jgi:hypothetical protein
VARSKLAIFRRGLFTIVSGISLLLCVVTIVFWVRSFCGATLCGDSRADTGGAGGQWLVDD